MSLYEINLLGSPVLYVDGNKISLSRNKSVVLIAYLACTGRQVSREELASLFWPDSTNPHGLSALRTVLTDIKSKLGSDLLIVDRNIIYISLVNVKCDVNVFIKSLPKLSLLNRIWLLLSGLGDKLQQKGTGIMNLLSGITKELLK